MFSHEKTIHKRMEHRDETTNTQVGCNNQIKNSQKYIHFIEFLLDNTI